ncbi:MAG: hypothetical protein CL610_23595 [Anaerolineaceae bacterium]|nr:hypothetical protein [Anaerolineaceae bacterium]
MSLYVNETGTSGAASILFLHGAGAGSYMWGRQLAALADFHCITVDLPGHGKSNAIKWVSLADTSDQLAAIIRAHANGGRAHIVGLSLGGYLALALLERHVALVDRVVISGVTATPVPSRALLSPQLWLLSAIMKRSWFVKMQIRSMHVPPDMQADFTENLLATSMPAYRRIAEEVVEYQLPEALRHVHNPTLVTAGSRESKIILHSLNAIPKLMPNAQGRIAPEVGHGWNVEAPDLFSEMARAWITDTPLPSRLQRPTTT